MSTTTQPARYVDPILKLYADLLTNGNKAIKKVHYGETNIGQSELPAIVISTERVETNAFSNAEDQHAIQIRVRVITSVLKDITGDNQKVQAGLSQLYDIIAGRNESDLKLKSTSLLDILRSNDRLGPNLKVITDLDTSTSIDYGSTVQGDDGAWSLEGEISFTAHFNQLRN